MKIAGEGISYGGFADAAAWLGIIHERPFTRQLVWDWHNRRQSTGFPEMVIVHQPDGSSCRVLNLDEVAAWYAQWVPRKGGRPAKGASREVA